MPDACPDCGGTGFVMHEDERGVVTGARCGCRAGAGRARRLESARIPPRYEHCTFEYFECLDGSHEAAVASARAWCEAFPAVERGLLLTGRPGRGKTHLAVAVLREVAVAKDCRGIFWEQDALLRRLRGTWDRATDGRDGLSTESDVWRELIDAELLVLDGLGGGRVTDWKRQILGELITERYNAMRPLVVTTSMPLEAARQGGGRGSRDVDRPLELADYLGDAALSRLTEMCQRVDLRGPDYRSEILSHRHS